MAGVSNFLLDFDVPLMYGSFLIAMYILARGNALTDLYLIIAFTPFYSSIYTTGGIGLGFMLPFVAMIKCIIKYRIRGPFKMLHLVYLFMILVYVFHDFSVTTFGSLINYVVFLSYPFFASLYIDFSRYNVKFMTALFVLSLIIVEFSIFMVQGGDLSALIATDEIIRLGEGNVDEGQKNQLGGAMELPIFSLTIITLLAQGLVGNNLSKKWKNISIVLIIVISIITLFTLSKVYLLGLSTLLFIMVIYIFKNITLKKTASFIGIIIVSIVAMNIFSEQASEIQSRYMTRIGIGRSATLTAVEVTTGRSPIYEAGIKYMSENPLCLLIGEGSYGYRDIGIKQGTKLSMSMHNIILDALMTFGLLGLVIISLYKEIYKRSRIQMYNQLLAFAPLIIWLVMNMTASTFIIPRNYIYLTFLVITINQNLLSYHLKSSSLNS